MVGTLPSCKVEAVVACGVGDRRSVKHREWPRYVRRVGNLGGGVTLGGGIRKEGPPLGRQRRSKCRQH